MVKRQLPRNVNGTLDKGILGIAMMCSIFGTVLVADVFMRVSGVSGELFFVVWGVAAIILFAFIVAIFWFSE